MHRWKLGTHLVQELEVRKVVDEHLVLESDHDAVPPQAYRSYLQVNDRYMLCLPSQRGTPYRYRLMV
jgi:hypothetical protein